LGERIRRLRDAAGMSQQALASAAGLSMSAVTLLELGKRTDPRLSTLQAIAGVLGIPVYELVKDLDEDRPPVSEAKRGRRPSKGNDR
jgi:transcriptional regulator with XRE-family HTH domain